MSSDITTIDIERTVVLPADTEIYVTDDQTVFYHYSKSGSPDMLYVKVDNQIVDTALPNDSIVNVCVRGNAIYFSSYSEIYKAMFTSQENIEMTHVRRERRSDWAPSNGICFLKDDGQTFAYHFGEDPDRDRILIEFSPTVLKTIKLVGIHRGRVIYKEDNIELSRPLIKKWNERLILLETGIGFAVHIQESSPFCYIGNNNNIHTFDTRTMEFLPTLEISGVKFIDMIVNVNAGEMTMYTYVHDIDNDNVDYYLATAQLPTDYEQPNLPPTPFSSRFNDEFDVIDIIGVGGFGIVFKAFRYMDKWQYAVKRIAVNPNDEENKLYEAQAMAQFDHPGIVAYNCAWIEKPPAGWQMEADLDMLKNFGQSSSLYNMKNIYDSTFVYIQMQLCDYSLSEWLDKNRTPSARSITRMKSWFNQIVSAVAYIHMILIHRDLKPDNILIINEDTLKICDMGISTVRKLDCGETEAYRSGIGSSMYMSPEHKYAGFVKYSSKTDVFALGLILVELCEWKSTDEKWKIFENYRNGHQSDHIADPETAEFVKLLTQVDPKMRPSCKEMLEHPYLA